MHVYTALGGDLYYVEFQWKGKPRRRYHTKKLCDACGKPCFPLTANLAKHPGKRSFCSKACRYRMAKGEHNANWAGGKKFKRGTKGGYILGYAPDHPRAIQNYVPEHRLVMEKEIGRYLNRAELVHHIDCDYQNNALGNLVVVTEKQHRAAHKSIEGCVARLMASGHMVFNRSNLSYEVVR